MNWRRLGVDSFALRFTAIIFLFWGVSSIQQGQTILGSFVIVASLTTLVWADQDCIYRKIRNRRFIKPRTVSDEPLEIREMLQKIEKIGASINSVIGRDLESGEFMWTEYDSLSPLAFPGQYFDRIVSEIRSFDFRIELNRYGPGIHLSVIKAADNEKLFNARRQSRNHHPIEVEISGMLNDAPEWYWEWKIRANEPGSWDWELDEYQIMIQWLTDIYQHCRDNDQLAFFTNLETTSKLDQIIKKARSTGIWPEVDEIVTV